MYIYIMFKVKNILINELKKYQDENKNKFESIKIKYDYIMVEFKRFMKNKLYIEETYEPKYNGNCYNFKWIKMLHQKLWRYFFQCYELNDRLYE